MVVLLLSYNQRNNKIHVTIALNFFFIVRYLSELVNLSRKIVWCVDLYSINLILNKISNYLYMVKDNEAFFDNIEVAFQ